MWNRQHNWKGKELVDDCEAFLSGRLRQRYTDRGKSVPVSAWMNLLAHGSEQDLRKGQLGQTDPTFVSGDCWVSASAYLATEVLDVAHRYGSLEEVQKATLVPLETELTSNREAQRWGVRTWVGAVRHALEDYCSQRERCERREKAQR